MLKSHALESLIKLGAFACPVILVALSLLPQDDMVRSGLPKVVEHFAAYGGAALIATIATAARKQILQTTAFVVLAGVLEYAQRWSPGREPGFDTFFASALGVGVGAVIGTILFKMITEIAPAR